MRILITGAGGGVGSALTARLELHHSVNAFSRAELDIASRGDVTSAIISIRPDAIVNCAAISNVDYCEANPAECDRINGDGPGFIAEAAEEIGAVCAHISTDYVFDGKKGAPYVESDLPCPINAYGRGKLLGEERVMSACSRAYVARTAWVMNPFRRGFLSSVVTSAQSGFMRVTDQTSSPTGVDDLVRALEILITKQPKFGIYHLVNGGFCSRLEMAREAFRLLGIPENIEEMPLEAFTKVPRPHFSALEAAAWRTASFAPFRSWQEALAEAVGMWLREQGVSA